MDRYIVFVSGPIDSDMPKEILDQAVEMLRPVFSAMGYRVEATMFDEADLLLAGMPVPKDQDV